VCCSLTGEQDALLAAQLAADARLQALQRELVESQQRSASLRSQSKQLLQQLALLPLTPPQRSRLALMGGATATTTAVDNVVEVHNPNSGRGGVSENEMANTAAVAPQSAGAGADDLQALQLTYSGDGSGSEPDDNALLVNDDRCVQCRLIC
jgi:hypothetical protein